MLRGVQGGGVGDREIGFAGSRRDRAGYGSRHATVHWAEAMKAAAWRPVLALS
jgi:hypothetical protein